MLTILRKNKQNIIFKIIFGVIIISFAAFFGSSGLRQRSGSVEGGDAPAVVNGQVISAQRFLSLVNQQTEQYRQLFKDNLPKEFLEGIKKSVIQNLVEETLLTQAIIHFGLKTSPQELTYVIMNNEQFQQNGTFNLDLYKNRFLPWYRDANGSSYEHDVMQQLALEKFIGTFAMIQTPNEQELKIANTINQTLFKFSVVSLTEEEKAKKFWDLWKAGKLKKDQLDKNDLKQTETSELNYTQLNRVFGGDASIDNLKTVAALTKDKPYPTSYLKEGSQYYFVKLVDLKTPQTTLSEERKQMLTNQYTKLFADSLAQAFIDELKSQAKIKIHSTLN